MRSPQRVAVPRVAILLTLLAALGAVLCWFLAQGSVAVPTPQPMSPLSDGSDPSTSGSTPYSQLPATVMQSVVDPGWLLASALLAAITVVAATNVLLTLGFARRE